MKFRKKPIEIEAVQLDHNASPGLAPRWFDEAVKAGTVYWSIPLLWPFHSGAGYWTINTPEGSIRAVAYDWIIRGAKGELYTCKPDVFKATYEAVLPQDINPIQIKYRCPVCGVWGPAAYAASKPTQEQRERAIETAIAAVDDSPLADQISSSENVARTTRLAIEAYESALREQEGGKG